LSDILELFQIPRNSQSFVIGSIPSVGARNYVCIYLLLLPMIPSVLLLLHFSAGPTGCAA